MASLGITHKRAFKWKTSFYDIYGGIDLVSGGRKYERGTLAGGNRLSMAKCAGTFA